MEKRTTFLYSNKIFLRSDYFLYKEKLIQKQQCPVCKVMSVGLQSFYYGGLKHTSLKLLYFENRNRPSLSSPSINFMTDFCQLFVNYSTVNLFCFHEFPDGFSKTIIYISVKIWALFKMFWILIKNTIISLSIVNLPN